MLKSNLEKDLQEVLKDLKFEVSDVVLSIPKKSEFGDYTTNIALQLANQISNNGKQNPMDLANEIVDRLQVTDYGKEYLDKIEVVSPGYINFYFKAEKLLDGIRQSCDYASFISPGNFRIDPVGEMQKILVEYASFNALKPVHVGHLRNIVLGESLTRLMEAVGQEVHRVTYTSDIGLPAAKVVWGLLEFQDEFKQAKKKGLREKAEFLGDIYVKANSAYEDDKEAKAEIDEVNTGIYHDDKKLVPIWKEALSWTFDYFETIYALVGTKFERQFLESEVAFPGMQLVKDNIGKVFREDDGAVIFPGEEFGLHNRVFITSLGNPTYEAKDMALAKLEDQSFPSDLILHIVANDQSDYFKVVFKALDLLDHDLSSKERHLSYGYVSLPSGKMSSRKGNVVTLEFLYDEVRKKIEKIMDSSKSDIPTEEKQNISNIVTIGAMKFTLLKYSSGTDIVFDIEKSVSLEGDSGPYIQYTYARAKSVLRAAQYDYSPKLEATDLNKAERDILQKIEHFPVLVEEATSSLNPTILANFLLELSRLFNLFYQQNQIIKSEDRSGMRLAITCAVASTIAQGLYLLGIEVVERM